MFKVFKKLVISRKLEQGGGGRLLPRGCGIILEKPPLARKRRCSRICYMSNFLNSIAHFSHMDWRNAQAGGEPMEGDQNMAGIKKQKKLLVMAGN